MPLLAFLAGESSALPAESIAPGSTVIEPITATPGDFIPNLDRYLYRVAIAVSLALRGESHLSV